MPYHILNCGRKCNVGSKEVCIRVKVSVYGGVVLGEIIQTLEAERSS